jgi:hypothetical protein
MVLRAHFDGKVLIPVGPVDLPKDKLLEIEVREVGEALRPGSPAAVLKAMESWPKIPSEYVDELERAIEEGKLPVRDDPVFDEDE